MAYIKSRKTIFFIKIDINLFVLKKVLSNLFVINDGVSMNVSAV